MEAGRELDALIAEKVMGWTKQYIKTDGHYLRTKLKVYYTGSAKCWCDVDGNPMALAEEAGDYEAWSPSPTSQQLGRLLRGLICLAPTKVILIHVT